MSGTGQTRKTMVSLMTEPRRLSQFEIGNRVRPWCIGLESFDPDVNTIIEKNEFFVRVRCPDGTSERLVPSLGAILVSEPSND